MSVKNLGRGPLSIGAMLNDLAPDADEGRDVSVRNCVSMPLRDSVQSHFITFSGLVADAEHFAVRFGEVSSGSVPLVRMQSECMTGDVYGSVRCDCGAQLAQAIDTLQAAGGILLYLRQ